MSNIKSTHDETTKTAIFIRDKNLVTSSLQQSNVLAADWPRIIQSLGQMGAAQAIDTLLQRVTLYDNLVQLQLSLASLVAPDMEAPIITHTIPINIKRRGVEMRLIIVNVSTVHKDPNLIKNHRSRSCVVGRAAAGQSKNLRRDCGTRETR